MISLLPFSLLLGSSGVYYAYENSDGVGQFIVIFLLCSSVFTWFIMLEKGVALRRARQLSEQFSMKFREQKSMTAMIKEAQMDPGPVAQIYISGVEKVLEFYTSNPKYLQNELIHPSNSRPPAPRKLTEAQLEAIQMVLEREISAQIMVLEERIGVLATAVSVSPFFGLFGTVWGVMLAFTGIAIEGKVNISALAPGVSGALLTTVVGLIVAIPSLIGYNLLTNNIRKITVWMDNFSEEFMTKIKLEQLNIPETPIENCVNDVSNELNLKTATPPPVRNTFAANLPRGNNSNNNATRIPPEPSFNEPGGIENYAQNVPPQNRAAAEFQDAAMRPAMPQPQPMPFRTAAQIPVNRPAAPTNVPVQNNYNNVNNNSNAFAGNPAGAMYDDNSRAMNMSGAVNNNYSNPVSNAAVAAGAAMNTQPINAPSPLGNAGFAPQANAAEIARNVSENAPQTSGDGTWASFGHMTNDVQANSNERPWNQDPHANNSNNGQDRNY